MSVPEIDSQLQEEVSQLDTKRKVLEQIAEIARAIEHMQDGLNSVLILGVSSNDLPREALELYKSLSGSMQNLPVTKIKEYLKNLQTLINSQLQKILQYSGLDFETDEAVEIICMSGDSEASDINPLDLLKDFKRASQTAVSLRVLLKKRGVNTEGTVVSVPQEAIKEQLSHLEQQEQQQRVKIKDKIIEMKEDIAGMLANPSYPDGMKAILTGVQANLDNDLQQIEAGRRLDSLSFIAETQELSEVPQEQEAGEVAQEAQPEEQDGKAGFVDTANRWLNTPWSVSWQDLKNETDS